MIGPEIQRAVAVAVVQRYRTAQDQCAAGSSAKKAVVDIAALDDIQLLLEFAMTD